MIRGAVVRLLICLSVCAGWLLAAAPADADGPTGTVAVAMNLADDGTLNVTETITPAKDQVLQRYLPLATMVEGNRIQHFEVNTPASTGNAETSADSAALTITARGPATVTYTVRGAVADVDGHQHVTWPFASGWSSALHDVTASFVSPSTKPSSPECSLGTPGSQTRCTAAQLDHLGVIRVQQNELPPDSFAVFSVMLPAGTVPPSAVFTAIPGAPGPFALTWPSIAALTGLGVITTALAGWVVIARRRDTQAAEIPVTPAGPLVHDADGTRFAAPDGVLPGQVGTVVDLRVDAVDLTATIVDLAVRGYLWIAETTTPGAQLDWQISRRAPTDDLLTAYETRLLNALLPQDTETVFASSFQSPGSRLDLGAIPEAMYTDAQRHRWFRRSPEHLGALTRYGIGALLGGVVITAALALSVGSAMIGVAVCGAGAVSALAGMLLPVRTARGRLLVAHMAALRRYLANLDVAALEPTDREIILTRAAPYAVVLGQLGAWLKAMETLDTAADGSPGIDWYETASDEVDKTAADITTNLPAFLTILESVLARGAHLQNLPQN
ncbi:DUF2207 domain-containing protein [Mycobacteroides saopaulense]|uniref:DUF2207 domain-containing protein n=1 Tax=Mycobacteroides saopaulense TaxID=1578165 RepID=A0ABX3BUS5_9MYCO|nr:DUF2207 domain-containing protein [Mycobacteroides saopaulense]OHT87815.1 hypothetical protein BKG68_07365 [Mycobacteroides saopaulense]OHU06158.1 hypothetical protein BKG73_21510 [Mycobacteroides saopaulense]